MPPSLSLFKETFPFLHGYLFFFFNAVLMMLDIFDQLGILTVIGHLFNEIRSLLDGFFKGLLPMVVFYDLVIAAEEDIRNLLPFVFFG